MKIRRLLQFLNDLGIFFEYRVNMYSGQCILIWDEFGVVRRMSLGTAQAYAEKMDDRRWGLRA